MAQRFTFTLHPMQNIAANKAAAFDFKCALELLNGAYPPESLWRMVNYAVAEKARTLSFSSHRPYIECVREVLHREPELKLGIGPYVTDTARPEFVFVDAEAQRDDDAN